MPYKLKSNVPNIEIVDGPFAGRKFVAGEIYAEIPANEKAKFDEVRTESAPAKRGQQPAGEEKTEVTDA